MISCWLRMGDECLRWPCCNVLTLSLKYFSLKTNERPTGMLLLANINTEYQYVLLVARLGITAKLAPTITPATPSVCTILYLSKGTLISRLCNLTYIM